MRYFLAKSEPKSYSIQRLQADKKTVWDGVKNAQALRAIREMTPGDRVLFYHSGGESQIVGVAEVASQPRPDPQDEKLTVIELSFLLLLDPPTTLQQIKGSNLFRDWALVRQSRLSTMAVPEAFVNWMRKRYPQGGL